MPFFSTGVKRDFIQELAYRALTAVDAGMLKSGVQIKLGTRHHEYKIYFDETGMGSPNFKVVRVNSNGEQVKTTPRNRLADFFGFSTRHKLEKSLSNHDVYNTLTQYLCKQTPNTTNAISRLGEIWHLSQNFVTQQIGRINNNHNE